MSHRPTAQRALVVLLALGFGGCSELQDLVSTDPRDFLTLSTSSSGVPADGQSMVTFTAHLSPAAIGDDRTVRFQADRGAINGIIAVDEFTDEESPLQQLDVLADVDGNASIRLMADRTMGPAQVTVSVANDIARSATVEFVRAYPDQIDVGLDPQVLDLLELQSETLVTVTLRRGIGAVTDGLDLEFSAVDGSGRADIGTFFNERSSFTRENDQLNDPNLPMFEQIATVNYAPGLEFCPSTDPCLVTVHARALNAVTGVVLEGSAVLELRP